MSNIYDEQITARYIESMLHQFRPYTESYFFYQLIGEVTGKEVLDLACGHGFYTRELKERGAARAVGVDVSEDMLRAAQESEVKQPLGIEYLHCDVADMEVLGSFDLVTAAHLLHYAPSREHLQRMCQRIYANLKPGGRFVGILSNPDLDPGRLGPMSVYMTLDYPDPLREGERIGFEVRMGNTLRLDIVYWSRSTYEQAFKEAGFQQILALPQQIHPQTGDVLSPEIAQQLRDNPMYLYLCCTRAPH